MNIPAHSVANDKNDGSQAMATVTLFMYITNLLNRFPRQPHSHPSRG